MRAATDEVKPFEGKHRRYNLKEQTYNRIMKPVGGGIQ
jgi:hypothetical protein